MRFLSRLNPVPGAIDLWNEVRRPHPQRWLALIIAVLIPGGVLFVFSQEGGVALPKPPDVTFISTFDAERSEAEIAASNLANQERQAAITAEREARLERTRNAYRTLARATGVDTTEMEREIAADEARAEAEAAARRAKSSRRAGLAPNDMDESSDP